MSRYEDACAHYEQAMRRVASTPAPKKQKFPVGSRVRIAADLGPCMSHFSGKGKVATVLYTYAHAYGGTDCKSYCLDIPDGGSSAWYYEHQLTPVND